MQTKNKFEWSYTKRILLAAIFMLYLKTAFGQGSIFVSNVETEKPLAISTTPTPAATGANAITTTSPSKNFTEQKTTSLPPTQKPSSQPPTQKPTSVPMTQKPTSELLTQKPSSQPLTKKTTSQPQKDKPSTQPPTQKPGPQPPVQKASLQPLILKSTRKPTSQPVTRKSIFQLVNQEPTSQPLTPTKTRHHSKKQRPVDLHNLIQAPHPILKERHYSLEPSYPTPSPSPKMSLPSSQPKKVIYSSITIHPYSTKKVHIPLKLSQKSRAVISF